MSYEGQDEDLIEALRCATEVSEIKDYLLTLAESDDEYFNEMASLVETHDNDIIRLEANDAENYAVMKSLKGRVERALKRMDDRITKIEKRLDQQ
jgi:hypothetical protein